MKAVRAARLGWGVVDQALSTGSNFALSVTVAHVVPLREFGYFSLVITTYLLTMTASRGLNTEPLVVRYCDVPNEAWRRATAKATGAAVSIGLGLGLAYLLAGLLSGGGLGMSLVALGLSLPGLLLQDSWRWAFITLGRPQLAAANDALWTGCLIPALAIYLGTGHRSVAGLVLLWGMAGWLGGIYGVVQARLMPQPRAALAWWREQKDLGPRYLGAMMALQSAYHVSFYGVGIVAGMAALGRLRLGWLIFGPFWVLLSSIRLMTVPEAVQALNRSVAELHRSTRLIAAALGASGVACGGVALALPPSLGRAALGSNWTAARSLVVPLMIQMATMGVTVGAAVGLRALLAARETLRGELVTGPVVIVGGLAGAALAEADGAAWGMALANLTVAAFWWCLYIRATARRTASLAGLPRGPSPATRARRASPSPLQGRAKRPR